MKRLLADGVTTNQQVDGKIHEDQLLNSLVNTLTNAFSLNLGENAEIIEDDPKAKGAVTARVPNLWR